MKTELVTFKAIPTEWEGNPVGNLGEMSTEHLEQM